MVVSLVEDDQDGSVLICEAYIKIIYQYDCYVVIFDPLFDSLMFLPSFLMI